jgi:hypothetical protein
MTCMTLAQEDKTTGRHVFRRFCPGIKAKFSQIRITEKKRKRRSPKKGNRERERRSACQLEVTTHAPCTSCSIIPTRLIAGCRNPPSSHSRFGPVCEASRTMRTRKKKTKQKCREKKNETKMPRKKKTKQKCREQALDREFAHVFLGIFQPHLRILVVVHECRHDDVSQQRWGVTEREK